MRKVKIIHSAKDMMFLYFIFCLLCCFQISAHDNKANMPVLLDAIERHDFIALSHGLKDVKLTISQKTMLYNKAQEAFNKAEKQGWMSSESKKGLFATLCVAFLAAGFLSLYPPLMILCFHDRPRKVHSRDVINQIGAYWEMFFGSLGLATLFGAASFASGYECEVGYYTNRPEYIRKFLTEFLKVDYWVYDRPAFT